MLEAGEVISVKLSVKYLTLDNILIMLDADELFNSTSNLLPADANDFAIRKNS